MVHGIITHELDHNVELSQPSYSTCQYLPFVVVRCSWYVVGSVVVEAMLCLNIHWIFVALRYLHAVRNVVEKTCVSMSNKS